MLTRWSSLVLGLALGVGCRSHLAPDGPWRFTVTSASSDGCGFGTTPPSLDGTLVSNGHVASIKGTSLGELRGFWAAGTERLRLDGVAAQVTVQVKGSACVAEQLEVGLELDGTTGDRLVGQVRYEVRAPTAPACACVSTLAVEGRQ